MIRVGEKKATIFHLIICSLHKSDSHPIPGLLIRHPNHTLKKVFCDKQATKSSLKNILLRIFRAKGVDIRGRSCSREAPPIFLEAKPIIYDDNILLMNRSHLALSFSHDRYMFTSRCRHLLLCKLFVASFFPPLVSPFGPLSSASPCL